ncbi:MAG: toluene tolerance protein [Zoogloeaceae bacterium]|jgi:hypothetical protein|nr:toluene tolerance protein [Zoogloeaceae bacterium]
MRIVTAGEREDWLLCGKVLEQDARGPKMILCADGHLLKIFHIRRHPFLARLQAPALRFADNAQRLAGLGVPVPAAIEALWLDRARGISACRYQPLPGETLEASFLRAPEGIRARLPELARFIRMLHRRGIYFRSLHPGNILLLPDQGFGLIDFLDLKHGLLPLGPWRIRRNFRHLREAIARRKLHDFPVEELWRLYWCAADGGPDGKTNK